MSYGLSRIKASYRKVAEYVGHVVGLNWPFSEELKRTGKDDRTSLELEEERHRVLSLISCITDDEWKLIYEYWFNKYRMAHRSQQEHVHDWIRKIELLRAFR